jgi:hypothetical protein
MTGAWRMVSALIASSLEARHGLLVACAGLLLAGGLCGCAGARSSPVVIHVGMATIDRATVDHWTRAIELGSAIEGVLGRSSSTPRQKALDFLISANWAIAAAAERGLGISDGAVARGLMEKIEGAPDGRSEFEKEIAATGQTLEDVRLEVRAALAASRLREHISKGVAPVTRRQVAAYYEHHLQSFRVPDRRLVDLIEAIHGYANAVALGRRLGPGERFAKRALHESVARQTSDEAAHRENHQLVHAIFTATPGRVAKPVSFNNAWVILVVRKLVPGHIRPLGKVYAEIAERLSGERRHRALTSFLEAYRREWTARTRCLPGFVVQKCSEYRGRLVPEGNLLAAS